MKESREGYTVPADEYSWNQVPMWLRVTVKAYAFMQCITTHDINTFKRYYCAGTKCGCSHDGTTEWAVELYKQIKGEDKEMKNSVIQIMERYQWMLESKTFTMSQYMTKFEVCDRTAKRDIAFLRTYKDYLISYDRRTGSYTVTREGTYHDSERKI